MPSSDNESRNHPSYFERRFDLMNRSTFFVSLTAVAALALAGCGDFDSESESSSATAARTGPSGPPGEPGAAAAGGINNGNGINTGFGPANNGVGPAGVPTTGSDATGAPYGGR